MINPFSINLPLPLVSKYMELEALLLKLKSKQRFIDLSDEHVMMMHIEDSLTVLEPMEIKEFKEFLKKRHHAQQRHEGLMGMNDALAYICVEKEDNFVWDIDRLQNIARLLNRYHTFKNPSTIWRSSEQVELDFSFPRELVHVAFEYAPSGEILSLMQEFTKWMNDIHAHPFINPMLKIGLALPLLSIIAPFESYNARMMHLIALDLFGFYGFDILQRMTFVEEITSKQSLGELYKVLKNLSQGEMDFLSWLEEWAGIVTRTAQKELIRIQNVGKMIFSPDRLHSVIGVQIQTAFQNKQEMTIAEVEKETGVNRNTLKGYLRNMVKVGMILQKGSRKASWYKMNENYQWEESGE